MWVCVGASLPIWAFYMFLGTALYVFFQQFPVEAASEMLDGTRKAEQVLPYFIMHYLPTGIAGLVIASALAAAMSSLDSSINAISTISVVDFYKRIFVKGKSDKHYLIVAWVAAVVASVLMIGGAIVLSLVNTKTLQDTATILVSVVSAGMLGIYMMGFFTRIGDARSVWIGIACTVLFTVWTLIPKYDPDLLPQAIAVPFDLYYTGMIGNLVMFFIGVVASLLLTSKDRDLTNLTVWDLEPEHPQPVG